MSLGEALAELDKDETIKAALRMRCTGLHSL